MAKTWYEVSEKLEKELVAMLKKAKAAQSPRFRMPDCNILFIDGACLKTRDDCLKCKLGAVCDMLPISKSRPRTHNAIETLQAAIVTVRAVKKDSKTR